MGNQFFSDHPSELDSILRVYIREINVRIDWIQIYIDEFFKATESSANREVFRTLMEILNHSMAIYRLLYADTAFKKNKARAEERERLISERWPGIPDPPVALREMRNDFEHIEEKFDEWAVKSTNHFLNDMYISDSGDTSFSKVNDPGKLGTFRKLNIEELTLEFWDHQPLNIHELFLWLRGVSDGISESTTI